jgi:uncharacterized repeat protein (TIGR03837 family)
MNRKITLLCKIVDNLGDAGVSLRFARLWVTRFNRDEIHIWTDDIKPFVWLLYGEHQTDDILTTKELNLFGGRLVVHAGLHPEKCTDWGDVVIEAFGSPIPDEWKSVLSQQAPQPVWVNLEYLSAEGWVEEFHGKTSIDPATGWKQLFFFPGFTEKTGGLLGKDVDSNAPPTFPEKSVSNKIFVFCYENAPVRALLRQACDLGFETRIATKIPHEAWLELNTKKFDFVPQVNFDEALLEFRLLFVRGEDSFVRAQLSGRPLVWQIYPTQDGAHWKKLTAFFEKYTEALECEAKQALWALWCFWNGGDPAHEHSHALLRDLLHFEAELIKNALRWRLKVMENCKLTERLEAFLPPRR